MNRVLLLLPLLVTAPAPAQDDDDAPSWAGDLTWTDAPPRRITPGAPLTSAALRVARGMEAWELPLLHTTVDARIDGLVAEVEVAQTYVNPFDEPIEATYLFPLPDDAAVHAMTMLVGDRRIVGVVKERQEARRTYEAARDRGQTAALLDQERPNVFTQRVANILPGESIEVSLSLAEVLAYEDGAYEWVMPLVVGPRYVPPEGTGVRGDDQEALDAPRSEGPTGATVDLRVDLDAGMPIRSIRSPSHRIRVDRDTPETAYVELDEDDVPNKDFILRYELSGDAPEVAALSQWDERGGHFLLMVQPPRADRIDGMVTPKDLVFLVDTSCSQRGAPMAAARRAMHVAIDGLNPEDTWSILRFDSTVARAVQGDATWESRERGLAFVDGFAGAGGTNMLAGVEAALASDDRDALKTILLITDGYVGNEPAILRAIGARRGRSRFFTLGTGSSVNRFLLDRAAQLGQGEVQVLRPDEDPEPAVQRFYDRIRDPLLTDVEVRSDGVELLDVQPAPIPDLFSGQPLILVGRYEHPGRGTITLTGRLGNRPWSTTLEVDLTDQDRNPALASLWARRRIEDLELRDHFGRASDDPGRVEREVTDLALRYSLMSQYTSFVAVREEIVGDGAPRRVEIPLETPEGVDFAAVAGSRSLRQAAPSSPAATGMAPARRRAIQRKLTDMSMMRRSTGGEGMGSTAVDEARAAEAPNELAAPRPAAAEALDGPWPQAPEVQGGEPVVLGALNTGQIRAVVGRAHGALRRCYDLALQRSPGLGGKVVLRVVIGPDGRVTRVDVRSSTLGDPTLEACLADVFSLMRFPAPRGGGPVIIHYPLVFMPTL